GTRRRGSMARRPPARVPGNQGLGAAPGATPGSCRQAGSNCTIIRASKSVTKTVSVTRLQVLAAAAPALTAGDVATAAEAPVGITGLAQGATETRFWPAATPGPRSKRSKSASSVATL